MKKLLLTIAMVAVGFTANAQDVKFGAKAGLNFASLTGNEEFTDGLNSRTRTGFHIGAMAEIKLSDKFAIQPELLYSTQGAKISDGPFDATLKLDYIVLPIMAKYYIVDGFNVQAGPQLGFNVNAKASAGDETVDLKDAFFENEGFDFGLNLGLGYELPMGLNFDARYNLGLTGVIKDTADGVDNIKNGVFQISVGYFF